MSPDDDALWPRCHMQAVERDGRTPAGPQGCADYLVRKWCEHVKDQIAEGADAGEIQTGVSLCVPVVPTLGMYAEVLLDELEDIPDMAHINLVKSIPFVQDVEQDTIGIWNRGEGRLVLAEAVHDWVRGQVNYTEDRWLQCPQSGHTFGDNKRLDDLLAAHGWAAPFASAFSIFVNSMCCSCRERYMLNSGAVDDGLASIRNDPPPPRVNQPRRPRPNPTQNRPRPSGRDPKDQRPVFQPSTGQRDPSLPPPPFRVTYESRRFPDGSIRDRIGGSR